MGINRAWLREGFGQRGLVGCINVTCVTRCGVEVSDWLG